MKQTFIITGLKPLTLNHTHKITTRGKFPKKYKTDDYKAFESIFASKMRLHSNEVRKLNKYFNDKLHCLHVDYRFFFPVLRKDGVISKISKDVDNIIKPTQDSLFKSFVFDDAFITKVSSEKIHSETPRIEITVKILTFYNK